MLRGSGARPLPGSSTSWRRSRSYPLVWSDMWTSRHHTGQKGRPVQLPVKAARPAVAPGSSSAGSLAKCIPQKSAQNGHPYHVLVCICAGSPKDIEQSTNTLANLSLKFRMPETRAVSGPNQTMLTALAVAESRQCAASKQPSSARLQPHAPARELPLLVTAQLTKLLGHTCTWPSITSVAFGLCA